MSEAAVNKWVEMSKIRRCWYLYVIAAADAHEVLLPFRRLFDVYPRFLLADPVHS